MTRAEAAALVVECAIAWRDTECTRPLTLANQDDVMELCDGENHVEGCAAETARQDLLAALNVYDKHKER